MVKRVSLTGENDLNAKDKDTSEELIAVFMAAAFVDQYAELVDDLDEEAPVDPGPDFWQKWTTFFLSWWIGQLTGEALASAGNASDISGVGVDFDEVAAQAENWASSYAFNLVTGINENTRQALQRSLSNFYADKIDFEGLVKSLIPQFSPTRAESIAVTETTRGFERGLDIYEDELVKLGFRTDRKWHTREDEKVCVICEPNNNKLRNRDGWTVAAIPAHPRDRCWTEIVVVTVKSVLSLLDLSAFKTDAKSLVNELYGDQRTIGPIYIAAGS
ncbi:MAG: hypothetical protein KAJ07_04545 [Planctomycetes bacterium]|nr:hypothetical protein [Planctomycetota bacterium]